MLYTLRKILGIHLGLLAIAPPKRVNYSESDLKIYDGELKLSVVTPSFNQANYIAETIQSVTSQLAERNLQYIIQDACSTDSTGEVVRALPCFNRLHLIEEKDSGQTNGINRGFDKADGDIMCYLNSDDFLLPGTLSVVLSYFDDNPDIDVVYGHRVLVDSDGLEIGRWVLPGHNEDILSWVNFIPQETLFWRRRAWERIGSALDENYSFAMDWDLLLRLRDSGCRFVRIPRFLAAFRIHEDQKTSGIISSVGFEEMNRLRKRSLGRIPSKLEIYFKSLPYLIRHFFINNVYRLTGRY